MEKNNNITASTKKQFAIFHAGGYPFISDIKNVDVNTNDFTRYAFVYNKNEYKLCNADKLSDADKGIIMNLIEIAQQKYF